ncbi:hypothetical protein HDV05_001383 [Chytridiales sp. JEL 0842]|nr:hypothetical protein HDV05_001383 [Chytridiales sp. JEL 0842]
MSNSNLPLALSHDDISSAFHGRKRITKADTDPRDSSWMDRERINLQAYEYLCHIGEAKEWIEACIREPIAEVTELEEELRNGIILAKLAKRFAPSCVKKIFDDRTKLQFRHSDNINYILNAMHQVNLPNVFFFELTDLYEKKNIPKVIYCIHALSHLLARKGLAPQIKNLVGQLSFTDEQLENTQASLDEAGVQMPSFGSVESTLVRELEPELTPEQVREAYLLANQAQIIRAQAYSRGFLARRQLARLRQEEADRIRRAEEERQRALEAAQPQIAKIQATWRMISTRRNYKNRLNQLKSNENLFVKLQARVKGNKERRAYLNRLQYLSQQADSAVKIQAAWRGKHAQKAYKALSSLNNPPLQIIQEFLHLLDDSDQDFYSELELDALRSKVVRLIRDNIQTEQALSELDLKIALLVKNRISLEEVVLSTRKMKQQQQREGSSGDLLSPNQQQSGPEAIFKSTDKESRSKVEKYGQLFYLLQTQPLYLSRLLVALNKKAGGQVTRFLEGVVLTLFGYAQNVREEYLLLNLIKATINLELPPLSTPSDFHRSNPLSTRLLLTYTRQAQSTSSLQNLLKPLLNTYILQNQDLDLETEPVGIYRGLLRKEEMESGEKSGRKYEVSSEEAAADEEVKRVRRDRVLKLKEITDAFLDGLLSRPTPLPYALLHIASHLSEHLHEKFPTKHAEILTVLGNLVYYRFLNPALVAPEAFDVVQGPISPTQRKNLGELAKVLNQIASTDPTTPTTTTTTTLQNGDEDWSAFIRSRSRKFRTFLSEVTAQVQTPEEKFGMSEWMDLGRFEKPGVLIEPREVFRVHAVLEGNMDDLELESLDPLRTILAELGNAPEGFGSFDQAANAGENNANHGAQGQEIQLKLVNRFSKSENEEEKATRLLQTETKRLVLMILRVQTGKNLLDVLESPVREGEEGVFQEIVKVENERFRVEKERKDAAADAGAEGGRRGSVAGVQLGMERMDGGSGSMFLGSGSYFCLKADANGNPLTLTLLKRKALENMSKLESKSLVSKSNNYQDFLNTMAKDMLNKHRRRSQRQREQQTLENTLRNLEEKAAYLEDQRSAYNDYISSCMAQLSNKKGSSGKKRPLPFTRQYYHLKELQKTGSVPQYGSFKYTAAELYKKGVLLSVDDYGPKQYNQITLTLSSDEAGVFNVEAAIMGIKLTEKMELRLEDLLQSQYDGVQVMTLFDMAKVNVNLMTYLLNKKFYV